MLRTVFVLILIAAAGSAYAQWGNPAIGPGSIAPIGPNAASSSTSPPVTCGSGVIDLSTGCTLGVLP